MTIQNDNEKEQMSSQTGSGLAQPSKTANKKMGVAIMLLGLLGIVVFALPNIIDLFSSEEKQEEQQVEKKTKIAKEYQAPIVEQETEQKMFSFDEAEENPPMERIGEVKQETSSQPPKLVKSLTGEMMNKLGGSLGDLQGSDTQQDINDDQANVNNAITNANAYLAQNGENESDEPKEKISTTQGDIFGNSPTFQASIARKSTYNPNLLLEQGTLIPCALRVRVISNVSGQLSCTITENVYSSNGNVLLIDKGSRVNGSYQGNSVQHGANQLFVIWQEVRTPDHLVIPLNSGSTDELGANGLNGWVDNHFWERFSNAIFLSMILDGNNILLNKMTDTVANNTQETREAGKEIATTVLEQMGDIKPTLYKNQGDKVGIFVARDVDFSSVYKLKRR